MGVLMKCGHSTHAVDINGNPACIICEGITPNSRIIEDNIPNLTGRKARCTYYGHKCRSEVDSKIDLAFFNHRPNKQFDEYYCGCYGWN